MIKVPSMWHRSRPKPPTMVVIHSIAEFVMRPEEKWTDHRPLPERYQYCIEFLHSIKLSTHAFVTPDGRVIETVPARRMAYHAKGYNNVAIGIEVMVGGDYNYETFRQRIEILGAYPWEQRYATAKLAADYMREFDIGLEGLTTHSSLSPGRKHDPGSAFQFDTFFDDVGLLLSGKDAGPIETRVW